MDTRYGYCECGCGAKTTLSVQDHPRFGWVKGEPMRFMKGHNNRGRFLLKEPYKVEDRGYDTPCWVWQGFKNDRGYGQSAIKGKSTAAHRMMYQRHKGELIPGMHIDHLCRVRACVNPDHLEQVTCAVNTRRSSTARLSESEVKEIRQRLSTGQRGIGQQLAREFGVSPVTISQIKSRKRWADV